ncbi:hypothetical protein [Eudoraea adriatica]|uniref:hypothetical protein n=1 Tax=Eudoraea adriatica TaxID=446681 RepID=UPI00037881B3|nr:hypothetical protein [Eudoraea adriatica]
MKVTAILSFLMLLVSCREEIKTTVITIDRRDILEIRIADLEREKVRLLKSSNEEDHIIINLNAHIDSLKVLLAVKELNIK